MQLLSKSSALRRFRPLSLDDNDFQKLSHMPNFPRSQNPHQKDATFYQPRPSPIQDGYIHAFLRNGFCQRLVQSRPERTLDLKTTCDYVSGGMGAIITALGCVEPLSASSKPMAAAHRLPECVIGV